MLGEALLGIALQGRGFFLQTSPDAEKPAHSLPIPLQRFLGFPIVDHVSYCVSVVLDFLQRQQGVLSGVVG